MTRRVPLWLALPAIVGLVLFLVYPTGYLIGLALTDSSLAHPLRAFNGIANFETGFGSPAFTPSLWKSTLFAAVTAAATTGIGLAGFNPLGSGAGAFAALLLIHIWQWVPFAVLILFAALGVVRPELLESARIDGRV